MTENVAKPVAPPELDRRDHVEMVKQAHEALVEANTENRSRFQDVLDYLERDLEADSP